ncbi:MAG TPA: OmpH family outer membrane protein [Planctomycetota bacterium]|nr:OmpH family outer membrane protein [Planctomycetota bacterium]
MSHSRRLTLVLLAAGALGAAALSGGARAQDTPPARALRIAVVNMGDCTEAAKNDHAKELSAKFDVLSKEAKDELARIRKKADELKGQTKNLEESGAGSPLYVKLFREWQQAEADIKIMSELSQRQLVAARDAFKNQLYVDARKMATVIAREMKIDLVLRSDDDAFEEDKSEMALQKNILRSVLYHDPALDITPTVLARLNEDHKKRKAVAPECPNCKILGKDGKCPQCGATLKN